MDWICRCTFLLSPIIFNTYVQLPHSAQKDIVLNIYYVKIVPSAADIDNIIATMVMFGFTEMSMRCFQNDAV